MNDTAIATMMIGQTTFDVRDCLDDDSAAETRPPDVMKSERNRLCTYGNWPLSHSQRPEKLAEAGLFYTGVGDRVQCAFCSGVLKRWQPSDVPVAEHFNHFPSCRFIRGYDVGNIPYNRRSPSVSIHFHQSRTDNISTSTPDYSQEGVRLGTFVAWPENASQTPNVLARAGFYHVPSHDKPDKVRCAYCHGKLWNWRPDDEPWLVHARCFPHCKYVKLCFGTGLWMDVVLQDLTQSRCPPLLQNEVKDDVTTFMESDVAQRVLQMGFDKDFVRRGVETYCRRKQKVPKSLSLQELVTHLLDSGTDEEVGEDVLDIICDGDS